jgi:hypothetical protein
MPKHNGDVPAFGVSPIQPKQLLFRAQRCDADRSVHGQLTDELVFDP